MQLTVGELIQELRKYPADIPVWVCNSNADNFPIIGASPYDASEPASATNPLGIDFLIDLPKGN